MDSVGAVVPAYQAATILRPTLAELTTRLPVVVVDDGEAVAVFDAVVNAAEWHGVGLVGGASGRPRFVVVDLAHSCW